MVYFLECQFNVDVATDYRELKRIRTDSTFFPSVSRDDFKQNLRDVILEKRLTPEIHEYLTGYEIETQDEVDEFLKAEIWQPIYGDERVTN